MGEPLVVLVENAVSAVSDRRHRLILLVGRARSGKTRAITDMAAKNGWPCINVSLALSEQLLDLPQRQRAARVADLAADLLKSIDGDVVLLDNIELLFAAELAQDPLRLLERLSRHWTVVASWPGRFDGRALSYGEPGHREFKKYADPTAVIVACEGPTASDDTTQLKVAR